MDSSSIRNGRMTPRRVNAVACREAEHSAARSETRNPHRGRGTVTRRLRLEALVNLARKSGVACSYPGIEPRRHVTVRTVDARNVSVLRFLFPELCHTSTVYVPGSAVEK